MLAAEADCSGAVRGGPSPLPCLREALGSAASARGPERGNGAVGAGPERGRHDDEGLRRLCRGDGPMGAGQCGLEEALRTPCSAALQYARAAYEREGNGLCARASSDRTRRIGFKLKEGRFRSDGRRAFLSQRAGRPWHCPELGGSCPRQGWG